MFLSNSLDDVDYKVDNIARNEGPTPFVGWCYEKTTATAI